MGASEDQATWIITSYLVSNAVVLPVAAYFATLIGRKRFYMSCVAMFGISSILCGLAPSLSLLLFFRVLQGIGGGGLAPSARHNCDSSGLDSMSRSMWTRWASTLPATSRTCPLHFVLAAVAAGLYFFAMLLAPLFPGTAWSDPEFTEANGTVLGLHPQAFVGSLVCLVLLAACVLAYLRP